MDTLAIDEKIAKLMNITNQFIFIEHYTHTGKPMYKILNPYTNYAENKIVLCPISEGIEKALDLAYEVINEGKENYYK